MSHTGVSDDSFNAPGQALSCRNLVAVRPLLTAAITLREALLVDFQNRQLLFCRIFKEAIQRPLHATITLFPSRNQYTPALHYSMKRV